MDRLSFIRDFRKLEEQLGKESSDLLLTIMDKREQMLLEPLATREDMLRIEGELKNLEVKLLGKLHQEIGNMAWKMTGLLILQAGVIVALIKLI